MSTPDHWREPDESLPVTDQPSSRRERMPPHSIDLERQVLGAMMLSRQATSKAVALLDRQVFYLGRHREMFDAILRLYERGEPADLTLLAEELSREGVLGECGGPAYLADVAATVGTSTNVEYHARLLIEKAVRRRGITLSGKLAADCLDETADVYERVETFQHELFRLSDRRWRGETQPIAAAVNEAMAWYDAVADSPDGVTGVRSGWPHLDRITAGFQPGEFAVVAARPGMGKTAFLLNVMLQAAVADRVPVALFSLEMRTPAIAGRLMVGYARIDSQYWRSGRMNATEREAMAEARERIIQAPIWIDSRAGATALEIRAKARRLAGEQGVKAIFVDYLQLVRPGRLMDNRALEVGQVAADLKALALDLNMPVIVASQVTREIERRGDNRPRLSDLRESGGIEQEADLVLFIHRPEYYGVRKDGDGQSLVGLAEIIVGKQRNGPQGTCRLWWRETCGRFDGMVDEEQAAYEADDAPF